MGHISRNRITLYYTVLSLSCWLDVGFVMKLVEKQITSVGMIQQGCVIVVLLYLNFTLGRIEPQ